MRIGVLTGGGDCPGLNAVIRAIVRKGVDAYGHEFVGFQDGWRGPLEDMTQPLTISDVRGILPRGGTILGSSRTQHTDHGDGIELITTNMRKHGVEALIAIGGEGTLRGAAAVHAAGIPVVGVPKTIDNDIPGTDVTFGFDTAVQVAVDAIDRLHTTAESHHRVMIVELMGRHAGWIALHAGVAGGANVILIPERPFDVEEVCRYVERRFEKRYACIIVVAEGAKPREGSLKVDDKGVDAYGHAIFPGIGSILEHEIYGRTGREARTIVLGHTQRGGSPSSFDRWLATRFGLAAIDAVNDGDFGKMVALHATEVVRVPLDLVSAGLKLVPDAAYEEVEIFFGT
jgi:6-phosphofructokinase 1